MDRLTCREFIGFLDDYLEGRLPNQVLVTFEGHLAACPYCRDYLSTYGDTIETIRSSYREDADAAAIDAPEKLVAAILAARRGNLR